jgi:hypothetical protein
VGIVWNRFPKLKSLGADFLVVLQSFMSNNENENKKSFGGGIKPPRGQIWPVCHQLGKPAIGGCINYVLKH